MSSRSRRRREREKRHARTWAELLDGLKAVNSLHEMKLDEIDETMDAMLKAAKEATPGPYTVFSDQGEPISLMPAMRPGDVCKFEGCENAEANAWWFQLATPQNVIAAINRARSAG